MAGQDIEGLQPVKQRGLRGGSYQTFAPSEPGWFSDSDRFGRAYPELCYWYRDAWVPDRRDAPAFFAGITFNEVSGATRYALGDEEWQATLPTGVTVGGDGRLVRVARTKYLSELVVAGGTFDEQAHALRTRATAAFRISRTPVRSRLQRARSTPWPRGT